MVVVTVAQYVILVVLIVGVILSSCCMQLSPSAYDADCVDMSAVYVELDSQK